MSSVERPEEAAGWGGLKFDAGSDMMDMNRNVDWTGEADNSESQLNLAFEKSISGC